MLGIHSTGLRAGRALPGLLNQTVQPTMIWGRMPVLPHVVMRQGADDSPNRQLQARCRQVEAEGALAGSLSVGLPNARTSCKPASRPWS